MRRGAALLAALLLVAAGACAGLPGIGRRPAWELPPPALRDAPVVPDGALRRIDLENGVRVLLLQDRRLPRVSLAVTLRRGEASVPLSRAGLAGFTADLLERGAGDRDALALAEDVEALGASLSTFAGWDAMGAGVAGLSRDTDALLEILADVVLRPRFEEAEARRLRGELLAGLERAADQPHTLAGWWTARALYPGHRFGEPRGGTPTSVATLDVPSARELHRVVFVPSNAVFAASGDIDPERLLGRVRELFGGWRGGTPRRPGPPPPQPAPAEKGVWIVDRPELEQAHIGLAHEGIERTHPERVAAGLLNSVLGGSGFSSRLMQSLRAEAGLTYGVSSGFQQRRQPGPFAISTSTRVSEARRVIDLLLAELEAMRQRPPGPKELGDAQMLALGRFALALETSEAVLSALVDLDVYGLPEDSLDTYRARLRAVTPADTAELARRLLHPERLALVLVGPAEALAPQLDGLGPVRVVQP